MRAAASPPALAPTVVAVIAYDGISPFHLSVPSVVFGNERDAAATPVFDFRVCSAERGPLATTGGFTITAPHGLDALDDADIVIVPAWRDPDEAPPDVLVDAVRAAAARGAQVVGLCLGAYVLAAAGLLDERPATTHWAWADDFARRFPRVKLDPDVLYVDDGNLMTSAGTAAGLDCCLHVVRQRFGADAANRIARRLVIPPHRQGGQAQYVPQPVAAHPRDARLAELLDWVRAHLDVAHSVDSLAARVLMSRRTFTRRFRQATGTTVTAWLHAERLTHAQHLLETTGQSIDAIAQAAGYGSSVSLRQHFAGALGTSPSAYRREFRGAAPGGRR
ncbi:helix-turn-helix domain-containing protein [Burkholderia vietnamiensis]|uniref:helix-turn-helix domain-containing protein n=1 Tax=Burkholderia vietnamiensis TaxID=60552 RepID=UPI001CB01C6A|nr:helix-turn-helix domain-containing protein [Burkholderia vietnamiensis]CAG9197975.1 Transcriptional regulator containing an amidase domain and an AraC-type DNA-binding HTH domain [Burkholderia vietnamiensis]